MLIESVFHKIIISLCFISHNYENQENKKIQQRNENVSHNKYIIRLL